MTATAELSLADRIGLPSLLGEALGKELLGVDWKPYPFIHDIESQVVDACLREDTQDWFIVNVPNQAGKSTWAGIFLTFWYIGMFPDKQVIFISFSDAYSQRYGRMVRDLFKKYGEELFGLTVDPAADAAGDWKLKGHPAGGMLSVGIGGQIMGRQGHLVIIDDILRTMIDAASTSVKDGHWAEWKGTIWGRRQPGSVYLVTATRLASDDLTGRLREESRLGKAGAIDWVELIYPGLCEPPDDFEGDPADYRDRLGRKVGEPLETRFSRPDDTNEHNWWTAARAQLDNDLLYDCMVQQNPQRAEGGMFPDSRWRYVLRSEWPAMFAKARAWDLAATKGGGDYTTGTLVGKSFDGDYYIHGRYRDQVANDEGLIGVTTTASADGFETPILIEEERSGAGKNVVEFYRRSLPGFQVVAAKAEGTKEQRATPYSVLQQGGHVILPADDEDQDWVKEWVKEHRGMMGDGRRPKHDDQIDTAAYAINHLRDIEMAELRDPNSEELDLERQMELESMLEELGI